MAQKYNLMASGLLHADAAWRLGPRAVGLALWGKGPGRWLAARGLGAAQGNGLDGADIRPGWEANRWTGLADPEAVCTAWMAANPPFAGPNWQCGQEAALRVLHLSGQLARPMPSWAGPVLAAHARRIAANPAYAMAQDNNHPISEAAGLLACGLMLEAPRLAARGARRLEAAVARLVAPDGGFAQPSPAYHRLMLDVLVAAETLRRRWGGPPPALAHAAAATDLLRQFTCPHSGALPRIGHQDGSAFDGGQDARDSLARAEVLFGATTARPAWRAAGFHGWAVGGARAILRDGGNRFRPAHADFLHLDLWDGPLNLLRDGGTGAYNPAPEDAWWLEHFWSVTAHNTVQFDGEEPMPRVSRFLHARWPTTGDGWMRDWRGRTHARVVEAQGREWRVTDRLEGPFRRATMRWRLAPGAWRLTDHGVEGPAASIQVSGAVQLEQGWESLAYGEVSPCPVLLAELGPARHAETLIRLPH